MGLEEQKGYGIMPNDYNNQSTIPHLYQECAGQMPENFNPNYRPDGVYGISENIDNP